MAGDFRYMWRWPDFGSGLTAGAHGHDEEGLATAAAQPAHDPLALLEDRDRALEDYLAHLSSGGKTYATIVIAASNSLHHAAADADYVCTGTDDDVTIQQAIADIVASPWREGTILLLDGSFNFGNTGVDASAANVTLRGVGGYGGETQILVPSTVADGFVALSVFDEVSDVLVTMNGGLGGGVGIVLINAGVIERCSVAMQSVSKASVAIQSFARVNANRVFCPSGANWTGIEAVFSNNVGTANYVEVDGGTGLTFASVADFSLFNSNIIVGCHEGIVIPSTSQDCMVHDNQLFSCGDAAHDALVVNGTRPSVQGNMVRKISAVTRYGCAVGAAAVDAFVTNNDLKNSGVTGSFNDAGTGTITVAGNRT